MTRGPIDIWDVKLSPVSTTKHPYHFLWMSDAVAFSNATRRGIWVTTDGERLWRVEPGVDPIRCRNLGPKDRGTSSGTGRESVFERPASGDKREA